MTQFWIIATILTLTGMALVMLPLWFRSRRSSDQDVSDKASNIAYFREQEADLTKQRDQGLVTPEDAELIRTELKKKLLEDVTDKEETLSYTSSSSKGLALFLALLIPTMAVPVYLHLGAQTELSVTGMMMNPDASHEEMISALEAWRDKRPDNAQAWYLLAGRYIAKGEVDKAIDAYKTLYTVSEGSPQAAAQLAQVLFLANRNQVNGEVRGLYQDALSKDESNTTALGLKGIDAFEREDYKQAVQAWTKALSIENDMTARQSLSVGITKARKLMGEAVAELRINVELAPELSDLPAQARVIVFARESGVKKPPIAAIPLKVSDLPKEVILDDNAAMMMGASSLSDAESLDVVARITLSGDVAQSDYQAEVRDVKIKDNGVIQLRIAPAS
ncbi:MULTISPECIES: c-type cytochrome biogenesis protein CcmI [unclassified Endozoicomonas]|uniref:c-type cytochrome biogenesis protein CcmI n=1 Tax=unclassified Endozoicomonas TaxID=2644528 RepID=UPI0021486600|nr:MULTISPECIES: c-type cytochrome biogenesis protein CcmI [unclassified Endozoicomonas]